MLLEVTRGLETSRNNLILKLAAAGLLQPRPDTNALPHFSPATREQLAHFLAGENADTVSPQQQLSPRRQQMLRRITWQYQDIARDLDMQTATVKSHMRDLAHQIGLSRQEIIVALGGMTDALIIDSPGSELDTLDARLALLSSAQRRVLPYLWLADKDIARVCNMSYHAAVVHIENILYVAGPASRLELIRHLARTGQLAPQPPAEQLPAFAPGIRRYLAQLLAQPE